MVTRIFSISQSIKSRHYYVSHNVSTEIFDWGFLYLLVGEVGLTKNEIEVQEF